MFYGVNLIQVLDQSLQRRLYGVQEDRFSFRTGLQGYNDSSDVSQVINYLKEQPGLCQPRCGGGRVREEDF